ncbi:GNAT family N-acetyltransferase [Leifsonia sp. NPDC080035]|uniref:GNAT family N-acetyltransferase n=1 Tax=Leifsonia sp. NPDC080035 TaxID=3143936 RepID=A0AAU7GGV6_9MICO
MDTVAPALLDRLADRGWPALEREPLDGWTLRASGGVTNRANSVLASGEPRSLAPAVEAAEDWYAGRGLPCVFQVSPASPEGLTTLLRSRGYREHSETAILVASAPAPARDVEASGGGAAGAVAIAESPSDGWLDTWWSVDGRGGEPERAIVERILAGGPALYAWTGDADAPDAVARLALVDDWGGLYAVATRPEARRRGHARALAAALAAEAAARGVERLWLQVLADNGPASTLYETLGFRPASRYAYWRRG